LALAAGIGAAVAIEAALHRAGVDGLVGLRWPNDVVEGPGKAGNAIRMKLAGVLIEAADGLAYVGIGINVNQTAEDFPQHLRERAISIRQIAAARGDWRAAGPVDRLEVATDLLRSLGRVIRPGFDVMTEWSRRDVLRGRMQSFRYDGRTFAGRVVSMDPLGLILIKTNDGEIVQLPALSTSLVHDA
jgi:BirA family biotin operon repressor/biotin-[acetyl-CoA-carboxylase] ligase